ncbi:MAG: hypothetical protein ACE5E9_04725 [Nitrospinaceae bacterium]
MPILPAVSIQQVLQAGTHAEKLQQTLQQIPQISAHQLDDERKIADEKKRSEIPDAENNHPTNSTNPDGTRRRQVLVRQKKTRTEDESKSSQGKMVPGEETQGTKIDLVI